MKKYHGVQVRKDKNGEDKKYPIFMGETATSLVVYTTFESLLPFKWDDISVKADSNSIHSRQLPVRSLCFTPKSFTNRL